jgi:hypothetical protein
LRLSSDDLHYQVRDILSRFATNATFLTPFYTVGAVCFAKYVNRLSLLEFASNSCYHNKKKSASNLTCYFRVDEMTNALAFCTTCGLWIIFDCVDSVGAGTVVAQHMFLGPVHHLEIVLELNVPNGRIIEIYNPEFIVHNEVEIQPKMV